MKIICAIDFSETSINACKWAFRMISEMDDASIHLIHCIHLRSRADVFLNVFDNLKYRAIDDLEQLEKELTKINDHVSISYEIIAAQPKRYLADVGNTKRYDLMVTGTQGLTGLKDMTIGSVTEYLMKNSKTPILAIPYKAKFKGLQTIIMGIEDIEPQIGEYPVLMHIARQFDSKIHMAHVVDSIEYIYPATNAVKEIIQSKRTSFQVLEKEGNIAETLEEFTDDINGQLICLVHKKRNWFKGILHKSIVKEELYEIETPLLILNDSKCTCESCNCGND